MSRKRFQTSETLTEQDTSGSILVVFQCRCSALINVQQKETGLL